MLETSRPRLLAGARWAVSAALAAVLSGCATQALDSESSSDVIGYQTLLEPREWLSHMSQAEIFALVSEVLETPIEFHGRVVDERGDPIADAEVTFLVFDHALDPFEFPYIGWTQLDKVKSDADGRFALTDRTGSALFVRVFKPGWKSVGNSKRYIRYASIWRYRDDHAIPARDEPTVFVMQRGMPLEDYALIESGAVRLPADGQEIELRLDAVNPYGVPPGQGDLAIGCEKGPVQATGRWDWFCRVRMTQGNGIQYRHDLVLQEAPVEGYLGSLQFGMAADDPDWDHRGERFVYVRLARPPRFGHIELKVRTAGELYIDLDGMLGLTGSRQLETRFLRSE